MAKLAALGEHVVNPEIVTAALGSWPDLHDAEILALSLERDPEPTLTLTVKSIPYEGTGPGRKGLLIITFEGVSDPILDYFGVQNVINGLWVDESEGDKKLLIDPLYGLQGEFKFTVARVVEARFLE